MKLLVLMGGPNKNEGGNPYPLYLTEIKGKILLETILENYTKANFSECVFCVRKDDIESFNLDSIIKSIVPNAEVVGVGKTKGAICTALLASEFVDGEEELLVVSADDFISSGIGEILAEYRKSAADVGLSAFTSIHPRYSFIRRDADGEISEFTEKKPVSREALASFYYFRHGSDFIEGAKNVIRKDCLINGAFYISQILNEMILKQKKIVSVNVPNEDFHSFKTERQLASLIARLSSEGEK